jgi:hypothetical protein
MGDGYDHRLSKDRCITSVKKLWLRLFRVNPGGVRIQRVFGIDEFRTRHRVDTYTEL